MEIGMKMMIQWLLGGRSDHTLIAKLRWRQMATMDHHALQRPQGKGPDGAALLGVANAGSTTYDYSARFYSFSFASILHNYQCLLNIVAVIKFLIDLLNIARASRFR